MGKLYENLTEKLLKLQNCAGIILMFARLWLIAMWMICIKKIEI